MFCSTVLNLGTVVKLLGIPTLLRNKQYFAELLPSMTETKKQLVHKKLCEQVWAGCTSRLQKSTNLFLGMCLIKSGESRWLNSTEKDLDTPDAMTNLVPDAHISNNA